MNSPEFSLKGTTNCNERRRDLVCKIFFYFDLISDIFVQNKFMKNYLRVAILASVLLNACTKNDTVPKTKAELLTSGSWKQTGAQYKVGADAWADYYSNIDACTKDDIITFKTDGTLTLDEGATKCDPNGPQVSSGMWLFQNNETILSTSVGISAEIEVLDEKTLQIVFPDFANPGNTNRSIYTR